MSLDIPTIGLPDARKRPTNRKRRRLAREKRICAGLSHPQIRELVRPVSLPGQLENDPTIAVQLECEGAIDGTNRRFVPLTLQGNEVKGSLRIPIILSRPNVVLVCQLDQIKRSSICLRAGGLLVGSAVRIPVVVRWVRISIGVRITRVRIVGVTVWE